MNESIRAMRDRESLGDVSALPDWASEVLDQTPFIKSDPELWVSVITEKRCQVWARGFFYGIDYDRKQVI